MQCAVAAWEGGGGRGGVREIDTIFKARGARDTFFLAVSGARARALSLMDTPTFATSILRQSSRDLDLIWKRTFVISH